VDLRRPVAQLKLQMQMRLKRDFFERDPVLVGKELLGNVLIRKIGDQRIAGIITETESYGDANDLASHARFGVTKRNKIMYEKAGLLYVYHIYGIFYLSNIICEKEGKAGAVLLRSAEIIEGKELAMENLSKSKFVMPNQNSAVGPGIFSIAIGLEKTDNYTDIINSEEIFIEKKNGKFDIIETKRIGVDYASHCKDYNWRFYIKNNPFISKK
jgi:DNA-3-methyladenine glycosylase